MPPVTNQNSPVRKRIIQRQPARCTSDETVIIAAPRKNCHQRLAATSWPHVVRPFQPPMLPIAMADGLTA